MTLDEKIAKHRKIAETQKTLYDACTLKERNKHFLREAEEHEQLAEWLEELKTIKEMNLSIPQHFTKEQSDWIKTYCIKRNIEFYNKAIDDFVRFASDMPTVEEEDGTIRPMWLEEIAEQLKAGGNS